MKVQLLNQVRLFPKLPGVYLMKDEAGQVIYVGKAKDLRARVKTYFLGGDGRLQIEYLVRKIHSIDKIVTDSEQQAFVLERDLITKYKPRYNIRLKDDKSYLSIRIDRNQEWPRLELVRKITDQDGALYFGPYSFSYELKNLLEIIKRVVPLRTCTDTVLYNRTRPCLEYQIKRCAGPCCLPVDRMQYMKWIKQAISILEGKSEGLLRELKEQMELASEELRFEDAAVLRDRIRSLEGARIGQALVSRSGEDRDIFAVYREEGLLALSVLRSRFGHIADNVNFHLSDVQVSSEEVIESAISQFYEGGRDIPDEIVVPSVLSNQSMICEALEKKRGAKLEITAPERGLKVRLLKLAELNARQHFSAVFDAEARGMELGKEMAKLFKLKQIPRRIECFDISNLQGSDIVGASVAFFDGTPDKKGYRKYKISFQDKPNDFAAMEEVVARRLRRGIEEGDLPDLLIIDGGPGQLAKAVEARENVRIAVEIVSLAKMRTEGEVKKSRNKEEALPERVYIEGRPDPIALDPRSAVTHLIQRIRDEAHRFVITFHRTRRSKRVMASVLDQIKGLGPERKRRLFKFFGSVAAMKEACLEDLAKAGRMPETLAARVSEVLTERAPGSVRVSPAEPE